jgi:hypothetical protein
MTQDDAGSPPVQVSRRRRDRAAIPLMVVLGLAIAAIGGWSVGAFAADDAPGPLVARHDPLLPDLAMGPIQDIAVASTQAGEQRLRFAATIVNIGDGPLLVRAQRPWLGGEEWSVEQWVEERDGGYSMTQTGAALVYGGDGHNHWHVRQVEVHQIESLDGNVLGRLVKQGFCFFDTDAYRADLPGAPEHPVWGAHGCASTLDTRVRMGLSVGWGDTYPWYLVDERIDVTDLPDGIYRLREIADPNDAFEEADETNNETWVDIELTINASGLRLSSVVQAGPPP